MPNNTQPDYIALAMLAALVIIVVIMVIRKARSNKAACQVQAEPISANPPSTAIAAPGSAGKIKLNGVPPKTAAMLMAIVAEKAGKPINELRFISIQEVKE